MHWEKDKTGKVFPVLVLLCQLVCTSNNYPRAIFDGFTSSSRKHMVYEATHSSKWMCVSPVVAQLYVAHFLIRIICFLHPFPGNRGTRRDCATTTRVQQRMVISLGIFFCIADQLIIIVQMQIEFLSPSFCFIMFSTLNIMRQHSFFFFFPFFLYYWYTAVTFSC